MIKNAKVSLTAVKRFEQSVAAVKDYSSQFDKGVACFEDFLSCLSEQAKIMRDGIGNMQAAQERLAVKTKAIEAEIAKFIARLNELQDQLSSLVSELANTPESFTMMNEEEESYEVPNPTYTALEREIAAVEPQISLAETELLSLQQRLEHANSVDGQLLSQIDTANSVICSLEEKQNVCRQFQAELEEIKNRNLRNGTSAFDSLKKIEGIVASYLRIKMTYENAALQNQTEAPGNGVNINININKTIVYEHEVSKDMTSRKVLISDDDIKKHNIRFDVDGRITEYDNKLFGGKYNSYETRLSRSSADDNPILGHYEGERGESKYIPSGRTVEGIVVKEILESYGIDGIEYRNAEPDFDVCSEAVVKISSMSENRENYEDLNGIPMMGNFSQADIECAKLWNAQKRDGRTDWFGRDVLEYRKAHGLTWHEKCDTETMVLVKSEINLYFKHSGGCSECRMRDGEQDGGGFDE